VRIDNLRTAVATGAGPTVVRGSSHLAQDGDLFGSRSTLRGVDDVLHQLPDPELRGISICYLKIQICLSTLFRRDLLRCDYTPLALWIE
jgi:hypothetical protein